VKLLFNDQMTTEQIYLRACLIAVPLIMTLLSTPKGLMTRLIAIAPLRYLGRISYSLYLYHLLMRNVVYTYRPNGSIDVNALLTIGISVGLASGPRSTVSERPVAVQPRLVAQPAVLAAAAVRTRPTIRTHSPVRSQPPVLTEQGALA
jgi:peptidoglycan/LPS O-acetylase OafA/YrhL